MSNKPWKYAQSNFQWWLINKPDIIFRYRTCTIITLDYSLKFNYKRTSKTFIHISLCKTLESLLKLHIFLEPKTRQVWNRPKNPVCWTWFFQIDFSEIKYRSTGGLGMLVALRLLIRHPVETSCSVVSWYMFFFWGTKKKRVTRGLAVSLGLTLRLLRQKCLLGAL